MTRYGLGYFVIQAVAHDRFRYQICTVGRLVIVVVQVVEVKILQVQVKPQVVQ